MPSKEDIEDLQKSLVASERDLEDRSGVGSAHSEERQNVQAAVDIEDQIERRSNASFSSEGTMNSVPGQHLTGRPDVGPPIFKNPVQRNSSGVLSGVGSGSGSHSGGKSGVGSGSGSQSSVSLKQRLAALQSDQTSMGITSSGSSGPASTADVNVLNSLTDIQGNALDRIMADIMARHQQEVDAMQTKLDTAEDNRKASGVQMADLKKHLRSNAAMQEIIDAARLVAGTAEEEKDEMKDRLAGSEARQEVHVARLLADIAKLKKDNIAWDEENVRKRASAVRNAQDELKTQRDANIENAVLAKGKQDELSLLRHNAEAEGMADEKQIVYLQSLLNAATRELGRRGDSSEGQEQLTLADMEAQQHRIEELLGDSREATKKMNAELAEFRLTMFNLRQGHEETMASMQSNLDAMQLSPAGMKMEGMPAPLGKGRKFGLMNKRGGKGLSAIEEEHDDDPSDAVSVSHSAISGQVSSDGVGVADLKDFEEPADRKAPRSGPITEELYARIALLTSELNEADVGQRKLEDEKADKEAHNASKISRITQKLHASQNEATTLEDQMNILKQAGIEKGIADADELAELQRLLQVSQDARQEDFEKHAARLKEEMDGRNADLEAVNDQLMCAMQLQAIEAGRLRDAKLELQKMEAVHLQVVVDLNARLQSYEDSERTDMYRNVEVETVERMQSAEQERNMLKNDLEWKEVHWKAQLENIQQQHQVDQHKLEKAKIDLEAQKEQNMKIQQAIDEKDEQLRAATTVRSVQPSQPKSPSFFSKCKCPARSSRSGSRPGAGTPGISVQNVCWQILTNMPTVVALHCSATSLDIMDASKSAYVVWGSRALHGSTLLDLLSERKMRDWLQKRLEPLAQNGTKDKRFLLQQLPGVSFRDQTGVSFDSSFLCASLPEEPHHMKSTAMLVIVDALEDTAGPAWTRHGRRPVRSDASSGSEGTGKHSKSRRSRSNMQSNYSECSDDITANDSISQVIMNQ